MKLAVNYILKVHTTLNESLSGVSTILFYCHLHSPLHIAFYCYKHQALTTQMFLFLTGYQLFLKENSQLLHAILNTHMYAGVEEGSQFRLG